jgi:predicted nucleotide-binding protein
MIAVASAEKNTLVAVYSIKVLYRERIRIFSNPMAKAQPPQRKPTNVSVEQMKSGIARLGQRIAELEGVDLNTIERDFECAVECAVEPIRKKVNSTLKDILGSGTIEYSEYELRSFYPHHFQFGESLDERQVHYTDELRKAALQLKALKEVLEERVAHAVPSHEPSVSQPSPTSNTGKVFIVHGHDHGVKEAVARFVENLGLEPIILHEQPNEGRTVIEKFEEHAVADFAIVLFTPDDIGHSTKKPDEAKPRARQNVVLELGYFMGKLSRKRVALLQVSDDIEIPSDYVGVLYLPLDGAGAWKFLLAKEMSAGGMSIDMNKIC